MSADILYSDSLVEISTETILFRRYYFPVGAKRLKLIDVERVKIRLRHLIGIRGEVEKASFAAA